MRVAETSLIGLKPVSRYRTKVEAFYETIRERFRESLDLLAEPKQIGENRILWSTRWEGEPVPFSQLTDREKERVRELLRAQLTPIFTNLYTYRTPGLRELLEQMLQIPNWDSLYYIRGADRVVLVNWGFVEDRFNAERDLIPKLIGWDRFPVEPTTRSDQRSGDVGRKEEKSAGGEESHSSRLKLGEKGRPGEVEVWVYRQLREGRKGVEGVKVIIQQRGKGWELETDSTGKVRWIGEEGEVQLLIPEYHLHRVGKVPPGGKLSFQFQIGEERRRVPNWVKWLLIGLGVVGGLLLLLLLLRGCSLPLPIFGGGEDSSKEPLSHQTPLSTTPSSPSNSQSPSPAPSHSSSSPTLAPLPRVVKVELWDLQQNRPIPGEVKFYNRKGEVIGMAEVPSTGKEVELPPGTLEVEGIAPNYVAQREPVNRERIKIPMTQFRQVNSIQQVRRVGERLHLGEVPYQQTRVAYQFKLPKPALVEEISLIEWDGDYRPGSGSRVRIIGVTPSGEQKILGEVVPSGNQEEKSHKIELPKPLLLEGVIIEPVRGGHFDQLGGKWEIKSLDLKIQSQKPFGHSISPSEVNRQF
ncbi:MAG: hypothetical protein ABGW77_04780 [Campylobacterales bacterium]